MQSICEEECNIEGYPGYTIDRTGIVRLDGIIRLSRLDSTGYYTISLKNPMGIHRPNRIKDLVARAYLPNDDPIHKKKLGTKNYDKKNHHVDNLIWRTNKEHGLHSSSIPIDTSDTRECKVCKKTLPMTEFPEDHPNRETDIGSHRRHHCRKCITASKAKPTTEQKAKKKDRDLRAQYGISLETFNDMMKAQENKCGNSKCGVDITGQGHSNVDHCHNTKKVRGILCPNCNKALGMIGDSIHKLQGLIAYLEPHSPVAQDVRMPVYSQPKKPTKTGSEHGNSGTVRSQDTRDAIAKTKRDAAAKKFELLFVRNLEAWVENPSGEKEKIWRYQISRKKREGSLPESCFNMLNNTSGWTFPQGTPHTTDSRVQPTHLSSPKAD